jgi:hypothetical protein
VSPTAFVHLAQVIAFGLWLLTLIGAGFFGMMAWMARAPLHTGRRWLRWSLYPALIWLITFAAGQWMA